MHTTKSKNSLISSHAAVIWSLTLLFVFTIIFSSARSFENRDTNEPWTKEQLLAPADLAKTFNDPLEIKPLIICVGPGALIKTSIDMGPAQKKENLDKLERELRKLPRDTNIVIYCGCCPFVKCPNIRPAFLLLNELKFSRHKLLNIEHNLRVDWINKGFPVSP